MKRLNNHICAAIFISGLLFDIPVLAQTIQNGLVTEINSGNRPVAGTAIVAIGAVPTDSDNDGKFSLVFQKSVAGRQVVVGRIYKEGYEVVNESDLKNWTLSEKNVFKIVLCKKGALDENRRRFYEIGQDRYYALYQQSRKELEKIRNENKMNTEQFNIELERIAAEYERAMSQLDFYADKFARINKDDLNELDARALALVEAGKPDEAIKLYEESKILQKFNERVAQRDTAAYNAHIISVHLENEIALLEKKNDSVSIGRTDSIYRLVLCHDSKNYSYNFNYASFLVQSNRFEEAFPYFKQSLLVSRNKEDTDNVLAAINRLYSYIENSDVIQDYKKQTIEMLEILEERKSLYLEGN